MEEELLTFWFQTMRPYWFDCPVLIDNLVTKKYKTILDAKPEINNKENLTHYLAHIILYDQLSRHIYRGNPEMITLYDNKARELFRLIKDSVDNFTNPEHRCFALMPCRHTFNIIELQWCLQKVTEWRNNNGSNIAIYRRFYQATLKAIVNINNKQDLLYSSVLNPNINNINILTTILDPNSPTLNTTCPLSNEIFGCNLYNQFKQSVEQYFKENNETNEIIISVSGGVDSMVCLYLTACIFNHTTIKIKALSINYANRPEQQLEIDMVNRMCSMWNIPHYVRTINEIKRKRDTDREFYEQITRDIRFDSYINIRQNNWVPVILGHNLDDCLENVFSNIKKQKNYNNLFGMEDVTKERDVIIVRPLLKVSKSDIIAFANKENIPYTYDSTPDWSERGKLRDQLIPAIKEFDSSLITGIVNMVNEYKSIYNVYKYSIPKIYYYEGFNECSVPVSNKVYILDYWKKIFTQIALHYEIDFAKNKSINHFISQIQNGNQSRITLSKHMVARVIPNCLYVYVYK
jgi:tRNA(Ile)-lysidine synthetase-like protein